MLTVVEAADLLDIGRTLAYELIRLDAWPTPVIRLGNLSRSPAALSWRSSRAGS